MLNPLFYVQAVLLALGQIWANKLRSILTTLGIILGVFAVTAVVAAFSGFTDTILEEFESLGGSKLFIFPDRPDDAPRNKYPWKDIRLKPSELVALQENCPSIESITPETTINATIEHRQRTREGVDVTGIWPDWHAIQGRETLVGRPFTTVDERDARQVCMVNEDAISELDLDLDPTGTYLLINRRRFLVVGMVKNRRETIFDQDVTGTEIIVPFATAVKMHSPEFFFMITAKLSSPDVSEEGKAEARFVLRQARQLEPDEPDTFEIFAADEFIESIRNVRQILTFGLVFVVGVSLAVGGIGIMNIMLVSVSERTREIGLRKAVGATPAAIMMQFLLEAVTLCVVGGAIGLLLGQASAFAMRVAPGTQLDQAYVPLWAVILSLAVSASAGVVFGMFPAVKAALLDPIDALRHE